MLKESQSIAIKEQAFDIIMEQYRNEPERMIDRSIHYTPPKLKISSSGKVDFIIDWFNILDTDKLGEYSKNTLAEHEKKYVDSILEYDIKSIEKAFLWVGEHFFALNLHVNAAWYTCTHEILRAISTNSWNISLKTELAHEYAFREFADDFNMTCKLLLELQLDAIEAKNRIKNIGAANNDCHLYFLHFPSVDSIKIGISKNLKIRAEKLSSEWGNIDFNQSFFITADRESAKKFEKAFHNLFHQNRSDIESGDGYTELFSMSIAKQLDEILATSTMNGFKKQKIEPEYIR